MAEVPVEQAKLLLVDDLPENLLALEALLRSEALEIFQASSAEAALELLLMHEFALAILDVQMPGMNGFELAEMMRGLEKTRHIPIVFVSAAGRDLNYAFKGYESGAVDFLHKPLDVHAVKSKTRVFVDLYWHRKRLAEQLVALEQSRQEQEILLAELRQTQVELQQAVRTRDDFMSMVSHELKTPLNTLMLEAQLRRMYLDKGKLEAFTPDKLAGMAERDERQIQRLVHLIDDMLDISRIRTGKLSIRPSQCDLAALVNTVVDSFASQFAAAGCPVELHAEGPAPGYWDEFRIEQVITNLLTNAMRYGAGRPVEISLRSDGADVELSVKDHGIGIPVEHQALIFRQFERASGTENIAGLGLGLYIADQIVKA
ncbi:hybrid sensor histidine kinase/response regulator, partial [uncultured Pseudomonas sp.]